MSKSSHGPDGLFGVDLTERSTPLVGSAIRFALGTVAGVRRGWLAEVFGSVTAAAVWSFDPV